MKKLSTIIIVSSMLSIPAVAEESYLDSFAGSSNNSSSSSLYLTGAIGFAKSTNKMSVIGVTESKKTTPLIFSIGAGYNMGDNLRADVTLNISSTKDVNKNFKNGNNSADLKGEFGHSSLFLNGYYDISGLSFGVTPYVTLGLGFARNTSDIAIGVKEKDSSKISFAYNLGFGATGKITDSLNWDAGYRFVDLGKGKSGAGLESVKFKQHMFLAGLRFSM